MKKIFITISFFLTFIICSGQCIEGDCENGFGKAKYENATYDGFFVNGNLYGFGIYKGNGDTYIGEFKEIGRAHV